MTSEDTLNLNKKNTAAFQEQLLQLNDKVYQQHTLIVSLQSAVTSLTEKLASVERMVIIQKASSIGRGPTVI